MWGILLLVTMWLFFYRQQHPQRISGVDIFRGQIWAPKRTRTGITNIHTRYSSNYFLSRKYSNFSAAIINLTGIKHEQPERYLTQDKLFSRHYFKGLRCALWPCQPCSIKCEKNFYLWMKLGNASQGGGYRVSLD